MSKRNRKPPLTRQEKLNRAKLVRRQYHDLKTAEKLVNSVMRSLKTEPDRLEAKKILIDAFEQLGLIYFARGRNGRSLYYFKRAIKLAHEIDNSKSITYEKLLVVSARVYIARGQHDVAEELYATAIGRLVGKGLWRLAAFLKEILDSVQQRK
jgi:tetratricopeptide (TPR) repeat protein